MKNYLYIAAAASLVLASCSSDNEIINEAPAADNAGKVAVAFNAPYLASSTRATPINLDGLKSQGFGVYAYEQGTADYASFSASNSYPNFFYNQQVNYETSEWKYSPVKYFSNNIGAKHSFFAYAPYSANVKAVFSLGNAPAIRFVAGVDDYDLLWAPSIINKEKPGVSEKLSFTFKHALAKVNINVAPFCDKVHGTHGVNSDKISEGTTVMLRSVKFIGKVPSQGLLSLENGDWKVEAIEESAYDITKQITMDENTTDYQEVAKDMMVIPSKEDVQIQVIYDVITKDTDHPENSSTVTNTVKSVETFPLAAGKAYTFNLDLGLTSVKFTADVISWDAKAGNVDLPNNLYGGLVSVSFTICSSEPSEPVYGQIYFHNNTSDTDKNNKFFIWNGSEWKIVPVTVLKSLNIKDGKVQTGDDASSDSSWTNPEENKYYVYNGGLYQWK